MTDLRDSLKKLNTSAVRGAAIDIGSLTIRLAIAEAYRGSSAYRLLHSKRAITHLGQGLVQTGSLAREPLARSLKVLAEYVQELLRFKVSVYRAVATQAVRQARNREAFLDLVRRQTGLAVEVLTPSQEAQLSLEGVLAVHEPGGNDSRPLVVFDVGGGSTEWALVLPGQDPVFASLPLGASTLTQTWIDRDPPSAPSLNALSAEIAAQLRQLPESYRSADLIRERPRLVGTAGTVTTLAAMTVEMADYEPRRINNYPLTRTSVDRWTRQLALLSEAERARLPGLEPAKAGVIVAGALIIQGILEFFHQEVLVVIDAGLLEGVLQKIFTDLRPVRNFSRVDKDFFQEKN